MQVMRLTMLTIIIIGARRIRGNHLSNAICITHVLFKSGE